MLTVSGSEGCIGNEVSGRDSAMPESTTSLPGANEYAGTASADDASMSRTITAAKRIK